MANPEGGSVNRTIDDNNVVANSGSVTNANDPDPASDTEQYGGLDAAGQRAGSKKKACFQITHITSKAAGHDANIDDPDSNDELDESRVDEYSTSAELGDSMNISKNSISDLDQSTNEGGNSVINNVPLVVPASGSAEEQTNSVAPNANQANGNGPHRFKVVKVATEPIRKGRWTCRDYPSESLKGVNQTTPEGIRNQETNKENLTHSGNSSAASSVHYVHGQDNNADNPLAQGGEEGGKPSELSRKISSTSSKDTGNQSELLDDNQKDDRLGLEQLKDELQEHTSDSTEGDEGTSPAGGAIDNKIEQAMDLVKSHLLFAVREEVEVLKEQIKVLLEKNEKLQDENNSLKQRLQTSGAPSAGGPVGSGGPGGGPGGQHQGMAIPPQSQDQTQYPSMPNQIGQANLGQNPMGQTMSDHAAYPQHARPTQQTHSTPNPGGLPEATPQYTPQTSVESQGQYHNVHSQRHMQSAQQPKGLQDMSQYSQVGGNVAATAPQSAPQPAQPTQGQYHTSAAPNH